MSTLTTCSSCGKIPADGSAFCNFCGVRIDSQEIIDPIQGATPTVGPANAALSAPNSVSDAETKAIAFLLVVALLGAVIGGLADRSFAGILMGFGVASLLVMLPSFFVWMGAAAVCGLTKGQKAKSIAHFSMILAVASLVLVVVGVVPGSLMAPKNQTTPQAQEQPETVNANDPSTFIKTFVHEDSANPTASIDDIKGYAELEYSIDPWALTASSARDHFLRESTEIIPGFFSKYPKLKKIDLFGDATLTDIRGNKSAQRVIRLTFTRKNSSTINWSNVDDKNVPSIADGYWSDPALGS